MLVCMVFMISAASIKVLAVTNRYFLAGCKDALFEDPSKVPQMCGFIESTVPLMIMDRPILSDVSRPG